MSPSYKNFLKVFTICPIIYLVIVFFINLWADSHGLRNFGGRINQSRLVKALQVNRLDPDAVLVGSSTVAIGFNPEHQAFEEYGLTYNLGMMGANFYEKYRYFQHAASAGSLQKAFFGLDFYAFNQFREVKPGFSESRLNSRRMQPQDFFRLYLSLEALSLINRSDDTQDHFAPDGTIQQLRNFDKVDRVALFAKHLEQNVSEEGGMYDGEYALSQEALNDLRELISIAHAEGIEVKFFLPPHHATFFYPSKFSKYREVYEEWLRSVVAIHPVWDFSGCNTITSKPIESSEPYYEDPLHFTTRVGDAILDRMYSVTPENIPADFGKYVTSENIDSHLSYIEQQCILWAEQNPETLQWLASLDL
ncbi:MAG: hypothetical protein F6K42_10690 [Leptolyngbya sp. SIO1D8]|nr:hypothetical protein [Leptolyngbya sp. SIO1D8]